MQSDLDEQKQLRIQEANHVFEGQQQQNLLTHEDTAQAALLAAQAKEGAANRAAQMDVTRANIQGNKDVEGMRSTAEQIVANIQATASKYAADLQANKLQVQQNAQGQFFLVNSMTGASDVMRDPWGQPMFGAKNVPENVALEARSLFEQAGALALTNPELSAQKQAAAQAMLGITNTTGQPNANPADVQKLVGIAAQNQGAVPPQVMSYYDSHYGQGAAATVVSNWKQAQLPSKVGVQQPVATPGAVPGLPGTPNTGAGATEPPLPPQLINGQQPPATAPATATPAATATPTPAAAPVTSDPFATPGQMPNLTAGQISARQGAGQSAGPAQPEAPPPQTAAPGQQAAASPGIIDQQLYSLPLGNGAPTGAQQVKAALDAAQQKQSDLQQFNRLRKN
jgi:hypothetical protein